MIYLFIPSHAFVVSVTTSFVIRLLYYRNSGNKMVIVISKQQFSRVERTKVKIKHLRKNSSSFNNILLYTIKYYIHLKDMRFNFLSDPSYKLNHISITTRSFKITDRISFTVYANKR